jgi:GNAT superfamily N-acetyltransferase
MICRAAQREDIPAMADQAAFAYRNDFAKLLPSTDFTSFDLVHFTTRFARDLPSMRVVEQQGTVIAFAMITQDHIDMFFVAGEMRGKGVGEVLLADAMTQGARTLETFAANTGARRFYERQGWRQFASSARPFGGTSCDFVSYRASRTSVTKS